MDAHLGQLGDTTADLGGIGEPRLQGRLPRQRHVSRRINRIYEDSEDARYPVLRVAPDGTLLRANRAGRDFVSHLGYGIGQKLPPDLAGLFPDVLRNGVGEDIELRSDEQSFFFTVLPRPPAYPAGPGDGFPPSGRGTAHDPRVLLEELPVLFYIGGLDGSGRGGWVSPGVAAMTGFSAEEFLSAPGFWESRLHPDDFWRVLRAFRSAGAAGGVSVEYRWRRADGSYAWFLDRAVLVNGRNGTERILAGARLDISAGKRREEHLQEGADFLENLLASVSDGVCLLDDSANFIYMNGSLENLLGIRRVEWARGTMEAAVHPDDHRRFVGALLAAVGGRRAGCRARLRARSGAYVEVSASLSPFAWKGRALVLASLECVNGHG